MKALAIACLVLRFIAVLMLALATFFIATNTVKFSFGGETNFTALIGFRYVLATSSIGLFYSVLQIPLAIYLICTEKRIEAIRRIIDLCIYGDKIIGFLLATGVGAGFAAVIDSRRIVHQFGSDVVLPEVRSKLDDYFNKGNVAIGFQFLGFISIATTSILYTVIRINNNRRPFFS